MKRALPLLLALLAVRPLAAAAAEKPNVLLVVIDTLRSDHLGAYGYDRPTSPRMDALAAAGVRFANARATSSWTAPSVASILTGLYPNNHGLQLPGGRLGPSTPTLAEGFRAAGYRTAAYSANPAFVSPRQVLDKGFEEFVVLQLGPSTSPDDTDVMPGGPTAGKPVKVAAADQVSDRAIGWLAEHGPAPEPFLLYLHYFDPHGGYFPPAEYAKRFGVSPDSPMLKAEQHAFWKKPPDPESLAILKSLYDGEIAFTDFQLGRVLDALPKGEPTLVVVTADHGEEFMDHGGMSHGRTLFEEMLRVPLIVSGAGVRAGVVTQPVVIADVWPTLADLAGLPAPAKTDGVTLGGAVREGRELPPRPLFADIVKAHKRQDMIHRHAVLQGSWKLIQNMEEGWALYDLATDPVEKRDAIAEEAARAAPLEALLSVRDSRRGRRDATGWRSRPAPTVALSDADKERMRALGYDPE